MRTALLLLLLTGCDAADFERRVHRANVNERIRENCVPEEGSVVIVGYYNGHLICKHVTPIEKYTKKGPHVTVDQKTVIPTEHLTD